MSTGLELIPLAIAIGIALANRRETRAKIDTEVALYAIPTRMRDGEVLLRALASLGADAERRGEHVVARIDGIEVTFAVPEGAEAFDAHLGEDVPEELARERLSRLDEAYVTTVREDVRGKVRARATEHGLTVASETVEADGSVLITLEVEA